ncbi:hypothetical protein TH53_13025 [Pedobacter lusitanus]|uniref:Uncharacterized protein n=1 Tax=Pedobacter lusitanus TaxID=1503925 RepID=A0A0D0F581_9SPHI|nr:hypothetical protein [Pedobacter lusitanus]KIO76748.1 hypothetical protein TH53_13025 [Pedobacter lusitanus]
MQWYHYFSGFWAGMFLANFVPHFTKGISGDAFPTPFANPPGKGLSSPFLNVVWALFNLAAGYLLFRAGKISADNSLSVIVFFAGIAVISLLMSVRFADKMKN